LDERLFKTHLDDIQSEMEASHRTLSSIADDVRRMRDALTAAERSEAAFAAVVEGRLRRAKRSIAQQLLILQDLRAALVPGGRQT
jgi:site-specific recombinase XerD